ncbi:PREDICTED: anti-Muellerian hormone type-2 receptor isoform X1 [Crocodylus porosus]|uniref:anti-Muellerian hormone type-2 receptor isoform X1 n=1 Tax=Crocodylus porosus TaxID=8502 RepID=UPI00093E5C06|nr:PREDICTED: anti-Muellerian hormone type-2 receptor isoform X1 [Crocodylus porosus]
MGSGATSLRGGLSLGLAGTDQGRRRLGGLSTQDPAQPRVSAGVLGRSCIFYEHPSVRGSLRHQGRTLRGTKPGAVQCLNSECCFGLWNQSHILMQGCWSSDRDGCEAVACVPSPRANVLRCLCRADLCNANISTLGATPRASSASAPSGPLWIAGVVLLFLGCLALLGLRRVKVCSTLLSCRARGKHAKGVPSPNLALPRDPPSQELPALHFLQVLQTGRFSVVWRGSLRGVPVVIKAFPAASAQHFAAEWGVLSRPLMNHENLVQLLEARRGDGPSRRGGLLVMPLYAQGSLRYFLSQHASPWEGTLRLALSLACGLAFLHDELWHDGLYKPSVAHRDLSSQNVLVRDDGACAITDFGLAMVLPTSPEAWPRGRSPTAIRKLGTQRYMAPEILDESLDLRRWGCALKQADIYAFALVLWEILTRCPALFPGCSVPEFRLAYEAELGSSPSPMALRRLVVEQQRRPAIPQAWMGTRGVPGCLQELLEDCWDPDPEARLTAKCAHQRLQRLGLEPPLAGP